MKQHPNRCALHANNYHLGLVTRLNSHVLIKVSIVWFHCRDTIGCRAVSKGDSYVALNQLLVKHKLLLVSLEIEVGMVPAILGRIDFKFHFSMKICSIDFPILL